MTQSRDRHQVRTRSLIGAAREEGIAWARAWRVRNRAAFDALYPETVSPVACGACGQALRERAE